MSMKVFMINGSPHKEGCTYTALKEIADELATLGIDSEIAWIGRDPIRGCQACEACSDGRGQCVFDDDIVNGFIEKAAAADGIIFGSPVYYAGINGTLKCLMDRMFYPSRSKFYGKPAAAVASARRAGTTATVDDINRFFNLKQMPIVTSVYFPIVHGNTPDEVRQDAEGLQTMRNLARNMAWMLECIKDRPAPVPDRSAHTNFIR